MKPKFRILKQGDGYYVQAKILFMWFYEKRYAPGAPAFGDYVREKFNSYEEAKKYALRQLSKLEKKPRKEKPVVIEEIG